MNPLQTLGLAARQPAWSAHRNRLIDRPGRAQYSSPTPIKTRFRTMSDDLLEALEAKMELLIQTCEELQRENRELRTKANDWQRERVRLIEKNELARGRVEAMITRLKSLEADS